MMDEMSNDDENVTIMHLNNVKIQSIKPRNTGLDDALKLLTQWGLPELHGIFKAQEISVRALKYLTDSEIAELIPKIGPRTIFRALLSDWREEQGYELVSEHASPSAYPPKLSQAIKPNYSIDFPTMATTRIPMKHAVVPQDDPIATKMEVVTYESDEWPEDEPDMSEDNNSLLDAVDNFYKSGITSTPRKTEQREEVSDCREYTEERFNVHLLLSNRKDGQAALDYYRQKDCLDLKNRKRVVKIIILAIVERRIEKYTALFDDITQQILKLFPNEKYEAYYVPHSGTKPARGALYYKYSNYTRQLRKEGIMDYKGNRQKRESYDSRGSTSSATKKKLKKDPELM